MQQIKLPVAKVGEIAAGECKSFRYGVQNGIAYNDDGAIKAYVNFCTHAGGPVRLVGDCLLRCGWHEAEFDPRTGERLSGEAPEGTRLKPIELVVDGEQVFALLQIKDDLSF